MIETMVMTAPTFSLTGLYGAMALLLLSLHLKSAWSWSIKSAAIGLAVPATVGAFWAIQAQLGWPSQAALPTSFQLHAALVDEPAVGNTEDGAIFLWLTPWEDMRGEVETDEEDLPTPSHRPRAFDLPYSRDLHQQVQAMQERLARGEPVVGRYERGESWQRRFNGQDGTLSLDAPPPPLLPSKDG